MSSPHISRTVVSLALATAIVPTFATHKHHHKATPAKHPHIVAKKATTKIVVDPALKPLVGTWYVTKDLQEDRSMKFAVRPNGTFVFAGTTYRSEGKLALKDGNLEMQWTMVDGTPVAPGAMHRSVPLGADQASFVIDKYTYAKSER